MYFQIQFFSKFTQKFSNELKFSLNWNPTIDRIECQVFHNSKKNSFLTGQCRSWPSARFRYRRTQVLINEKEAANGSLKNYSDALFLRQFFQNFAENTKSWNLKRHDSLTHSITIIDYLKFCAKKYFFKKICAKLWVNKNKSLAIPPKCTYSQVGRQNYFCHWFKRFFRLLCLRSGSTIMIIMSIFGLECKYFEAQIQS